MEQHDEEVIVRAQELVAEMQRLEASTPVLPPGTISMASMSVDDAKSRIMIQFIHLMNAITQRPELQGGVIDVVRKSSLSQNGKVRLWAPLGLE